MTEYTYTENFFTNGLNTSQIHNEIVAAISDPSQFDGILREDDNVIFRFFSELGGSDFSAFEQVLANHNPSNETTLTIFADVKISTSVSSPVYKQCAVLYYPGLYSANIKYMKIYSWIESGTGTYDVRVVDLKNNVVMAEDTLTNTSPQFNILNIDQGNLTKNDAQWEIHVRTTSTDKVSVSLENAIFYY